jgi:hypothetical protein
LASITPIAVVPTPDATKLQYPATELLRSGAIHDVITATYARVANTQYESAGTPMNLIRTAIGQTAILASATGLAALTLAGPASADVTTEVLARPIFVNPCPSGHPVCGAPQQVQFTTTKEHVKVDFTKVASLCPDYNVEGTLDGRSQPIPAADVPLAPGNHTLTLDARFAPGGCKGQWEGGASAWGGRLVISEFSVRKVGKAPGTAKVIGDVEVYNRTDGPGKHQIGILRVGQQVPLIEPCSFDAFCHVSVPEMEGGSGYAWAPGLLQPGS